MKNIFFIAAVLWTYCLSAATKQPEQIIPVPFNEVTLTGGFWGERMHRFRWFRPVRLSNSFKAVRIFWKAAVDSPYPITARLVRISTKSWKERPIR